MIKERLTMEDRILIEELLRMKYKLKDIAIATDKHSSTISREIKCRRFSDGNNTACSKTNRFPFICHNCSTKRYCRLTKYYYSYKKAHQNYLYLLKSSRRGIDMSIDETEYWNDYFKDKIHDKNQPILHIWDNIKGSFPKTIQTFYSYVHKGYFSSINDEMLARSTSYKPRKKKEEVKTIHKDNIIKKGRRYNDFKEYIKNHPNASIVEMDLVIGKFEDKFAIMTLYFRKSKLMLTFLVKKYKTIEITNVFNNLKRVLGSDKFQELFEVILTDNGWEFSKPADIEYNCEEKLVSLFYCEPYSSWQKGGLEKNHEFIRYIIPKGITFDNLTQKNIIDIMNNINNVSRKSLDYQSPYQTFNEQYGDDISDSLHLKYIKKDEVNLGYKLLQK